jgi:hypothetical protein
MWNWITALRKQKRQAVPARWLDPGENPWGLRLLDCSQNACSMMSTAADPEIARTYARLRNSTGEELRSAAFHPTLSIACNLAYDVSQRIPDGPVFKSQVMEEKWDIYIFDDYLYFCRSWGGQIFYRVALQHEPRALKVHLVEAGHKTNEKATLRDVDFLIKSHVLSAKALHSLPQELGRDIQKLVLFSFSAYGRMGLYGTIEETIGTPYFADHSISNRTYPT